MIRTLFAAAALALCAPGLALAQTAGSTGAMAGVQMTSQDALASKLIGSSIYSAIATNGNNAKSGNAATNAAPAAGTPANGSPNGVAAPAGATATGAQGAVANTASDTNAQ